MQSNHSMGKLSQRERQVVLLAADGLVDKEIAGELGVTTATVRSYWSRLRKKTSGANKVQIVVLALECLDKVEIHKSRLQAQASPA